MWQLKLAYTMKYVFGVCNYYTTDIHEIVLLKMF